MYLTRIYFLMHFCVKLLNNFIYLLNKKIIWRFKIFVEQGYIYFTLFTFENIEKNNLFVLNLKKGAVVWNYFKNAKVAIHNQTSTERRGCISGTLSNIDPISKCKMVFRPHTWNMWSFIHFWKLFFFGG